MRRWIGFATESDREPLRRPRWQVLAAGLVLALLGGVGVATAPVAPASAATVACDGASSHDQNQLRVTPSHGTVFYIDSGQSQQLDAAYAAYNVSNLATTTRDDLWVQIDGFTGGVIGLARPGDASQPLGDLAGSASATSFTLLKASSSTTLAQSHVVHVYQGKPGTVGASELYRCTYTFTRVAETIKAAANKVSAIQTTTVSTIGSTLTVTVQGSTGTIGAGNDVDGSMMWFSPAGRSSWPTGALRLESTRVQLYGNGNRLVGTYDNQLRIGTASGSKYSYTATYTFRIIGSSATAASVLPIAQISSGTQIKHTDLGSITALNGAPLATDSATVAVKVTKATSRTVDVADGMSTFSYTVTLSNTGSAVSLDAVTDTRASGLSYVAGSARYAGSATSEPTAVAGDGSTLVFSGPFAIPAGSSGSPTTRTLTYQMQERTCSGTFHYTNAATGSIGSIVIGSDSSHISVSHAFGNCGATTIDTSTEDQSIDPEVTTSPATSVGTTTAHLNGLVDPNGTSGSAIIFRYGTDPTLATSSTVSAGTTTSATTPYAVGADLTGLATGTVYYVRVEVGSVVGDILSFVTSEPVGTPVMTTTAATGVTTAGAATFNGFVDPNQVPNGAKVKFQYASDSSGGACSSLGSITTSDYVQSETDSGTGTTDAVYTGAFPSAVSLGLTGLTSNSRYCYRAVGYYNASSANWSTSVAGDWVAVLIATKTAQTITFPALADTTFGTAPTAAATASSTLTVTYVSNTPDVCTISPSGAIVLLTAGTCSITAGQPGNDSYAAATPVTVSFAVARASQTITFAPGTTATAGDILTLGGTASSTLTVAYTAGPSNVCGIVAGSLVTGPDSGVCTVEATQAGNAAYTAATPVSVDIVVNPGPPVITTASLPDGTIGDPYDVTLAAAGGDGSYDTWTITAGALPAGLVFDSATGRIHGTPTATAEVTLTFTVRSSGVTSATHDLTLKVAKSTPTITASDISLTYGDSDTAIVATTDSRGTLSFESGDTSVITIVSGKVHVVAAGSTTLRIVSAETAAHAEGSVTVNVTVARAMLTVTAPSPTVVYGDAAPVYQATITGFVLGEYEIDLISDATCSSSYAPGDAVGSDPAVVCLGAAAANYDFAYVDGIVDITKAAQVITVSPEAPVDMPPGSTQSLTVSALGDGVPSITTSGPCTWSAGVLTADATEGECVVTISVPASANHQAATPVERRLQVSASALIPRTIALALDLPGTAHVLGTMLHLVATVTPTATPTLVVDAASASICRLESDLTVTLLAVGECVIHGDVAADGTYSAATATLRFDVERVSRTLGLTAAAPNAQIGQTVRLTGLPSAGAGTITYRLADAAGHCALAGDIVSAVSVGTCDVAADITADDTYLAATSAVVRLEVLSVPTTPPTPPTTPPTIPSTTPTPTPSATPTPTPIPQTVPTPQTASTRSTSTASDTPSLQPVSGTVTHTLALRPAGRLPLPSPGVGGVPIGLASSGERSPGQLAGETFTGFAPGTGVTVHVTGARTTAQFVVDPSTLSDPLALAAALDESSARLAAHFASLTSARVADAPAEGLPTGPVTSDAHAVFAAAGLADPILPGALGSGESAHWVIVTVEGAGYVPGSVVYLAVTTQPVILGAAVAGDDGTVQLTGSVPIDLLPAGAHDLRLVGTRALTGATAGPDGAIQLSTQAMDDIRQFDAGTWATVQIEGSTPSGGAASAVRVVLLGLEAPWWTVIALAALALVLLGLLLWRRPGARWRQVAAAAVVAGIALPAVLGWLSRSYDVVAVGAAVGLVGAALVLLSRLAGRRTRRAREA